jgi:hypothetical protein
MDGAIRGIEVDYLVAKIRKARKVRGLYDEVSSKK